MNPTRLCLILALGVFALPALAAPEAAEQAYQAARKGYYALKKDPKRRKFRDSWLTVAHRFEAVAKKYPKSARAPDSLFTAAQLLSDLSRISLVTDDATASMEDYRALLESYPRSSLADDAALALARAYLDRDQADAARKVLQRAAQLPRGDQTQKLQALAASLPPETARKAGKGDAIAARPPPARDASAEDAHPAPAADRHVASTTHGSDTRATPATRIPSDARSSPVQSVRQSPARPVETPEWLKQVTTPKGGTADSDTTPAADETSSGDDAETPDAAPATADQPKAAAATDVARKRPVAGIAPAPAEAARPSAQPDAGAVLASAPPAQVRERLRAIRKRGASDVTLAEQLGLKFRRVVIDPGHGGHDTGTVGEDGTQEKDVALAISKRLKAVLTDQGLEVVLTRETDRFVRLEERARLANAARGDLFISVHCNSLPQRHIRGIETYTLNLASDRYAIRLAARENATSEKGMSDLRFLLADLATRANTEESVRLATQVQAGLVSRLTPKDKKIRDLGTKDALFYVLLGTKMPAILVETGFLSNREEEKRLVSPGYQDEVARAIAAGVQEFLGHRDRLAKAN